MEKGFNCLTGKNKQRGLGTLNSSEIEEVRHQAQHILGLNTENPGQGQEGCMMRAPSMASLLNQQGMEPSNPMWQATC